MISYRTFLVLVSLAIPFAGCEELVMIWTGETGTRRISSFPTEVGTDWRFTRTLTTYNYRPIDTSYTFVPSTQTTLHFMTITKQLSIPKIPGGTGEMITVTEFRDSSAEFGTGYVYYETTREGLWNHGTVRGGMIAPATAGRTFFTAHREFSRLEDIITFVESGGTTSADSIMRNTPPLLAIRLPLRGGEEWAFSTFNGVATIGKRCDGIRKDPRSGLDYAKVIWLFDWDHNGEWDEGFAIADWISERGLLKRVIDVRDILVTSPAHSGIVGYVDILDTFTMQ